MTPNPHDPVTAAPATNAPREAFEKWWKDGFYDRDRALPCTQGAHELAWLAWQAALSAHVKPLVEALEFTYMQITDVRGCPTSHCESCKKVADRIIEEIRPLLARYAAQSGEGES